MCYAIHLLDFHVSLKWYNLTTSSDLWHRRQSTANGNNIVMYWCIMLICFSILSIDRMYDKYCVTYKLGELVTKFSYSNNNNNTFLIIV